MNDAPSPAGRAETLYDRLWRTHVVCRDESGRELIYIDRQILHEVSTPQSFALLRENGLRVRRPETQLAVPDHAVPTAGRPGPIANPQARAQVALLEENCRAFGIEHIALDDPRQGIVHVVSPEQGFTLPGITLICGDSHTATHGAFGALAFGVGASECGTAMATQCLWQRKARTMRVAFSGLPGEHVSTKDLALALIARIGAAGATGHAIEYTGEAVRRASMEARMSLCNMAIEAGSRTGLVAPDETTFGYLAGRPRAPAGAAWDAAVASWRRLRSDEAAVFDREVELDAARLAPQVSYGTSPDQVVGVDEPIPEPAGPGRAKIERALAYMGLRPGMTVAGLPVDHVFIGSCTNGRIEDLRAAAAAIRGRKVAEGVRAIVVPGSGLVKAQAEAEGLDRQFLDAGFEWRSPGCSLCVAMNGDIVPPGGRAISTSNRNFEGRQGPGARTHLASPATAAASAVAGRVVDVRKAG